MSSGTSIPSKKQQHVALRDAAESMLSATIDALSGGQSTIPDTRLLANERFEAAFSAARLVSFDVFDTLVVRKAAAPRDVFLHLATPQPFAGWGLPHDVLAVERIEAEREARLRGQKSTGSFEVTLHEVHAVLAERLGRPAADVPAMVAAERLVERALCVAHPYLRTWFDRARRDGKVVWVVSDTYHEAAFLDELLRSCGYDLEGVVIVASSEARASKGEGGLFKQLLETHQVRAKDILHIGDHPDADDAVPTRLGLATILHPWAASRHSDAPTLARGDSVAVGLAQIGARAPQPAFPFWWRFGYSVAGPMLVGFALWLEEQFRADKVSRAYFLLRDGEIIEKVYRALGCDQRGPTVALLESSRRAFFLPGMQSGEPGLVSQLLATENPRPAREFLERLGIDPMPFRLAFRQVGFSSLDDIVPPLRGEAYSRVQELFRRPDVLAAILERSRVERSLLMEWLEMQGLFAPGRIAFVDIGWNGTIQRAFRAVSMLEQRNVDVMGYYLGTLAPAHDRMPPGSSRGYLFECSLPQERASTIASFLQLIEFICTSDRGSLKGFKRDEAGQVVPVHGKSEHGGVQATRLAQLHAGVMAFAHGMREERLVFGFNEVSPDAAMRRLSRVIRRPTTDEAHEIGDVRHGEGTGTARSRAFASFDANDWDPKSLMRQLRTSYWPAGLMARQEPQAVALRMMQWLGGAQGN
jgi:predicted HAD superfamily hydrolase